MGDSHAENLLQGYDILFYGDSITEQWRGSAVGADYPSLQETKEIFQSRFNSEYRSHVLAIAGKFTMQCSALKHPRDLHGQH